MAAPQAGNRPSAVDGSPMPNATGPDTSLPSSSGPMGDGLPGDPAGSPVDDMPMAQPDPQTPPTMMPDVGDTDTDPDTDAGDPVQPAGPSFPSVADPGAMGAYTPMTVANTGPGGGYTLYHPAELSPEGAKHPFITWGNGATTTPPLFSMLPHLASHGFVVIASNNAFVTGQELKQGLDWLESENGREGSQFFEKLDPTRVASMGYSLGSLGTFEIADDPRLTTTLHISGGAMDKSVLSNLKKPAAFLCGNSSDIAYANCVSDFEMVSGIPLFFGVFPGDHLGILLSHTAQITHAATGWLRWQLMDDAAHAALFVGSDCGLCQSDSGWTVQQKGL